MNQSLTWLPTSGGGKSCFEDHKVLTLDIWSKMVRDGYDTKDALCVVSSLVLFLCESEEVSPEDICTVIVNYVNKFYGGMNSGGMNSGEIS